MRDSDFRTRANELVAPILDLCKRVIEDKDVKLVHRLKAAEMILNRTTPTLRSIELQSASPVTVIIVSPQQKAKMVLDAAGISSAPALAVGTDGIPLEAVDDDD